MAETLSLRLFNYPVANTEGLFVFQAKFVEAANAAGARPDPIIRKAVYKEVERIGQRIAKGETLPTHYILFTNAPCKMETREAIFTKLKEIFKSTEVHIHVHDGNDICAWLDSAREITRAFPTILGFSDLEALLRDHMERAIFERSKAALEGAVNLAKVFVPTRAYYNAVDSIAKQGFVVLSGPPEAGKTAIGKMICLAQHARGWEVIECRDPEDVLKKYQENQPQCFLADDFFGRTEFDPTRAQRWEAELPGVLKRLDNRHWLILTSRAHILHIGEREVDIDSEIIFPQTSEVVVEATSLTKEDRARILYRHAKSAELSAKIKISLKSSVWSIIEMRTFTAERVRRLVQELGGHESESPRSIIKLADIS
ncbi:MAG: hypothetical protein IPL96_15710, partial [Holophagaceae bacterium]|nr:hypothetical protein [Holophagaceae bacterium]